MIVQRTANAKSGEPLRASSYSLYVLEGVFRAGMDPDVLSIEREDGSVVAVFSRLGFAKAAVERAAWEDFGEGLDKPLLARRPPLDD